MSLCWDKASFLLIEHCKERRRTERLCSIRSTESVLAAGSSQLALCLAVTAPMLLLPWLQHQPSQEGKRAGGDGGAPIDSDMNSNAQYQWVYDLHSALSGNRGPIGLQAPILDTQSSLQGALRCCLKPETASVLFNIVWSSKPQPYIPKFAASVHYTIHASPRQKSLISRASCFMLHMAITD